MQHALVVRAEGSRLLLPRRWWRRRTGRHGHPGEHRGWAWLEIVWVARLRDVDGDAVPLLRELLCLEDRRRVVDVLLAGVAVTLLRRCGRRERVPPLWADELE